MSNEVLRTKARVTVVLEIDTGEDAWNESAPMGIVVREAKEAASRALLSMRDALPASVKLVRVSTPKVDVAIAEQDG